MIYASWLILKQSNLNISLKDLHVFAESVELDISCKLCPVYIFLILPRKRLEHSCALETGHMNFKSFSRETKIYCLLILLSVYG